MAAAQDILSNNSGDLLIINNDFQYGLSDPQHITDTLEATPLSWKQYPADGVGLMYYLNSAGRQQQLQREIKLQLTNDGYTNIDATIVQSTSTLNITPYATRI
jgi:hypothetical protein